MRRYLVFAYGVTCYAIFLITFVYAAGFVGGVLVPTTIDGEPIRPVPLAIAIDLALLGVFAVQHSLMARPVFKRWWTQFVPEPAERSTYVLFSSFALGMLFACWQPLAGTVWRVDHPAGRAALWGLCVAGWLTVLVSTFLINHFDLFGLRQVWLHLLDREYAPLEFRTPGPYRLVRHPLYVGWLTAFWATPTMTTGHLAFAIGTTAYILVAIRLEERDLTAFYGAAYADYRSRVPMLLPRPRKSALSPRPESRRAVETPVRAR